MGIGFARRRRRCIGVVPLAAGHDEGGGGLLLLLALQDLHQVGQHRLLNSRQYSAVGVCLQTKQKQIPGFEEWYSAIAKQFVRVLTFLRAGLKARK